MTSKYLELPSLNTSPDAVVSELDSTTDSLDEKVKFYL